MVGGSAYVIQRGCRGRGALASANTPARVASRGRWGPGCSFGVGAMATQTTLRGRDTECAVLDRLLDAVRAGESRALVLRGEPGVGKTALLDYAIGSAPDLRLTRAA